MKEEADVKAVAADASYAAARATVWTGNCYALVVYQLLLHRVDDVMGMRGTLHRDQNVTSLSMQEYLIEEMAARAFQLTLAENRDTISYSDVGEFGITTNEGLCAQMMPAFHLEHGTCRAKVLT